ncbi:MAG: efflux RND transporter periplasmic adaptor subunit [Bacteroidales bacterium]|nr:efflux RND transporter periplasmic adaptor subunit [Bacteroidales bacterium]
MKYKYIVLTLLVSALFGCNTHRQSDNNESTAGFQTTGNSVRITPGSPISTKLKLLEVEPRSVDFQLRTTASVGPKSGNIAEIGLPFGGRVVRSFVRLGDPVRRGQVLFEVNSTDYMEAVKEYLESRSASELAQINRQRKESLHQSGMLSDREWEEISAESRNAENAYEIARRSLALFNVDPASVQAGQPLRVVSPISGRVVRNDLVIGGYLSEEDDAPVTVADLSTVWVTANVKASQVSGLFPGQSVNVEIDPEHQVNGKIFYVGDLLDEKTRTLPVVIECINNGRMLKPGMFVSAVFDRRTESMLAVPSSAIFQGEEGKFVYVQDSPDSFKKVAVRVESLDKGLQRVISGLSGGETIIADGGIYLSE